MKKITVKASSNIAFIKYWGKKDEKLRLPMAGSVSMNLGDVYTVTTVEFDQKLKQDRIEMVEITMKEDEKIRVSEFLDKVRQMAKVDLKARIMTKNNFPKGTGIASSASGFAALAMAASRAIGLVLTEKELSILARLGSGSACRSIPDGFVEWKVGVSSQTSFAKSIFASSYWDIVDVIVIVAKKEKKISSSLGHSLATASPFIKVRIAGMDKKIKEIKETIKKKDFSTFGQIIEAEALNMHAVMMTSSPPLLYWQPKTIEVLMKVIEGRALGVESYFTIDAGPNVHVICQKKDLAKVKKMLLGIKGIVRLIVSRPGQGASTIDSHLF